MSDSENVTPLGVKFRPPPPEERTIAHPYEVGRIGQCNHLFTTYLVSPSEAEVTCGKCDAKLNPVWVLGQLAQKDHQWHAQRRAAERAREVRAERQRTKCDHCGRMTRIRGL